MLEGASVVASMGDGREHQLTAAMAGPSVRQVVLVFLFFRDENSVVFKLLQN